MAENQTRRNPRHPVTPIGTKAELKRLGFNPKYYGSCSPQDKNNIGCARYEDCTEKFKEVEGQAPEYSTFRIIKAPSQGGGVKEGCAPCFAMLQIKVQVEGQGGFLEPMGGPGTSYVMPVSKRVSVYKLEQWMKDNPGKAAPKHLSDAAVNPNHPDSLIYTPDMDLAVCPTFPRPDKNPILAEAIYAQTVRERAQKGAAERKSAQRLGIELEDDEEEGSSVGRQES